MMPHGNSKPGPFLKTRLPSPLWSEHNFLYAIKDQGPQLTGGFGVTLVWLNQGSMHCRPEEIQKQLFSEKKVSSGTLKETMVSLCLFSMIFKVGWPAESHFLRNAKRTYNRAVKGWY